MLLVKGVCHAERMRKDGKSLENLKIEDTRQEGRGGGNERSHRGNLDGTSRLPVKGAVRRV